MRRKYFALAYFAVCSGLLWLSGCESQAKSETDPVVLSAETEEQVFSGPTPRITFPKLGHDFGEVSPNRLYKADIKFTNTGEGTLEITKVSKCCGIVAKLAGEKKEYAPGESGVIQIEWRSGSTLTVFTRELVVHSNDTANPTSKLNVQAKIVLKITWEPNRLRLALDEDNADSPKVTISCLDDHPFSITSFKSTGDCITADFDPSVEATKFVLEPKADAEKLHKNLKGRIMIGMTHPDGNAAIVPFDVLPKYTIDQPSLQFFDAEPNKPIVRKISVLNNYKRDFGVDSLSSRTGAVGVRILSKRRITNGYQLDVEVMPPASEGKAKFLDEFYLTLEDGEELTIRCNGYYKKTRPVTTTQ
ncbi:MAG: DUF1573 domain-containing protein [Planctomycetota bacterium]|nr:DUF1573 domain-containing protein [Planctomycetota bacterium]